MSFKKRALANFTVSFPKNPNDSFNFLILFLKLRKFLLQTGQKMEIKLTTILSKGQIHNPQAKILTTVTVTALPEKGALVCLARTCKDQLAHSLGDLSCMILSSETENRQ